MCLLIAARESKRIAGLNQGMINMNVRIES